LLPEHRSTSTEIKEKGVRLHHRNQENKKKPPKKTPRLARAKKEKKTECRASLGAAHGSRGEKKSYIRKDPGRRAKAPRVEEPNGPGVNREVKKGGGTDQSYGRSS